MVQPKNFDFGEEEVMLRDSVRKFFENNLPTDKLHAMVAANPGWAGPCWPCQSRQVAWV